LICAIQIDTSQQSFALVCYKSGMMFK